MIVSIISAAHLEVYEDSGFVEICVEADHESQTTFEVLLRTTDVTAIGMSCDH